MARVTAGGQGPLRVTRLARDAQTKTGLGDELERRSSRRQHVGAVLYMGSRSAAHRLVTMGDLVVRFGAGVSSARRAALARQVGVQGVAVLGVGRDVYRWRTAEPLAVFKAVDVLERQGEVLWAEPVFQRARATRGLPDDPLFNAEDWAQWHLRNTGQRGGTPGQDVNVASVWQQQVGGAWLRGAHTDGEGDDDQVIAIVDDGLEVLHPDLQENVLVGRSHDWVDGDDDPTPSIPSSVPGVGDSWDRHGTACAGVAAARGYNGRGVTGSAPWAGLVGFRFMAAGWSEGADAEAEALAAAWRETPGEPASPLIDEQQVVDVSSSSWGPLDDRHLEGAPQVVEQALQNGVQNGRGGRGIVYVWAAGNGRIDHDNVNYDGYANSRYTIAVGATTDRGRVAGYSESGAPLMVVAPSGDGVAGSRHDITTTDLTGARGANPSGTYSDYTNGFGGTSSSAPVVAGVVALMLQAQPDLSWRDVQVILMSTARKIDAAGGGWQTNAAGHHVSHTYGYGLVDAQAAVDKARTWQMLGTESVVQASASPNTAIPDASTSGVTSTITLGAQQRLTIEYVEVVLVAPHTYWSDLEVTLIAPSGTRSVLSPSSYLQSDGEVSGFNDGWRFGSALHLGESSQGTWRLRVRDLQRGDSGRLASWTLKVYGTQALPDAEPPVVGVTPTRTWWNKTVKLQARATDVGSNVARVERRVAQSADGPFAEASSVTIKVDRRTHRNDGRRTVWFRATDNSGNVALLPRVINVDTRRPRTQMRGNAGVKRGGRAKLRCRVVDPGFSSRRVHVWFQVRDARGRVRVTWDAGMRSTRSDVVLRTRVRLPRGRYKVRALARDAAGNKQSSAGAGTLIVR